MKDQPGDGTSALVQPSFDLLIAAAVTVAGELEVWLSDVSGPRYASASAAALTGLALAWRRRAPLVVAVAVLTIEAGQVWLGVPKNALTVPAVAIVIAMYTLGEHGDVREMVLGGTFALAALWSVVLVHSARVDLTGIPYTAALVVAPLVLGRALRSTKREAAAAMESAERERERATREAIAEERARIARELHDVVSHSISAMGVQASAVRRLLPPGNEELDRTLGSVEATGREALGEMQRLLGIVRSGDGAPSLTPQPGLGRVTELVEQARAAGLAVELRLEAAPPLPPGLDLAAYRIVQEALTNVRRHAGAANATVSVRRNGRELEIVVTDDGPRPTGLQPGHGIIGMRERARIYGGELEVRPGPERGCVVTARLPIAERG